MPATDTIAAVATATGEGAIAIVRISGPAAVEIGGRLFRASGPLRDLPSHRMILGRVMDGSSAVDRALAVVMRAPRSFTGEDVVEIHTHGGRIVARSTLEAALRAGARPAEPGEFTRRAFLNGKIDLTQAEAVADLVRARTDRAARLACRQMEGALGRRIREAQDALLGMIAEVEAGIDFPEDDVPGEDRTRWDTIARRIDADLARISATAREGRFLRDGARVAIAGRPNVGKSSLLNALAGLERAIVSEHPGTTRDAVEIEVEIEGIPVRLMDTAGLRESADAVERLGVRAALGAIRSADLVLLVRDASSEEIDDGTAEMAGIEGSLLPVLNKIDLRPARRRVANGATEALPVSAKTGEGLDRLASAIAKALYDREAGTEEDATILVTARHQKAIETALAALQRGRIALTDTALDKTAADWRLAWDELGAITGEAATEQILDEIFGRFCIGK